MARLFIDLRTNYTRAEINHIDITILHRSDSRYNRFIVIPTIPTGDLAGVRLTGFRDLDDGRDYTIIGRMFLNGVTTRVAVSSTIYRLAPRERYGIFGWRSRESTNIHTLLISR